MGLGFCARELVRWFAGNGGSKAGLPIHNDKVDQAAAPSKPPSKATTSTPNQKSPWRDSHLPSKCKMDTAATAAKRFPAAKSSPAAKPAKSVAKPEVQAEAPFAAAAATSPSSLSSSSSSSPSSSPSSSSPPAPEVPPATSRARISP
jgi:hypothetical protein